MGKRGKMESRGDLIGSNEDLLRMILIHLYDKPLCRFKSVSKLWLSLISDPDFITKHPPSPSGLLLVNNRSIKLIPLDTREVNSRIPYFNFIGHPDLPAPIRYSSYRPVIIQSCNGLLLVSLFGFRYNTSNLALFNYTANELKLIPKLGNNLVNCTDAILHFDPSKSPHYKVILTAYVRPASLGVRYLCIYESEKTSWRLITLDESLLPPLSESSVYWNGAIHWSNKDSYFDLEELCYMAMPMLPDQDRNIGYFGESGGHLLMIYYDNGELDLQFDVFEMDLNHSKWFVKYKVDLTALSRRFEQAGFCNPRFKLVMLIVNGDQLVLSGKQGENEVLVSYKFLARKLIKLSHLSLETSLDTCKVWPFTRLPPTKLSQLVFS